MFKIRVYVFYIFILILISFFAEIKNTIDFFPNSKSNSKRPKQTQQISVYGVWKREVG